MQSDRQRQYLAGNGRLHEAVDILETPADVHHEDSGESQRLDASLSLGGEDTAFEDIFNGIEFDEVSRESRASCASGLTSGHIAALGITMPQRPPSTGARDRRAPGWA
jgi:hypothetical protein